MYGQATITVPREQLKPAARPLAQPCNPTSRQIAAYAPPQPCIPLSRPEKIVKLACAMYGLTRAELMEKNRSSLKVAAREYICVRLSRELNWNSSRIGLYINRNRASVNNLLSIGGRGGDRRSKRNSVRIEGKRAIERREKRLQRLVKQRAQEAEDRL